MPAMLEAIRAAARPVALTGAGISAPSGVPTFQTRWRGRPIRDFLGREFCQNDPVGFFEVYCAMEAWCGAPPNAAHLALASHQVPVITQNIDGLHQKAGSGKVIELHGNLRKIYCRACGIETSAAALCADLRPLYAAGNHAAVLRRLACACGGRLDGDVVLYGDAVRGMDEAMALLDGCDLFVVIGTTLTTYPAAMLPDYARRRGARLMMEDRDCVAALTEQEKDAKV
ncbi:MAG: NAD-dependent protein deacylase [Firmicutes bacterium]|nr:NAD-dependent protein deacylase [Bacillota bacterium]